MSSTVEVSMNKINVSLWGFKFFSTSVLDRLILAQKHVFWCYKPSD